MHLKSYLATADKFGTLVLEHYNNFLQTVPLWHDHQKTKNWMAVVKQSAFKKEYLRTFCEKSRPPFFYETKSLRTGDVVEFAADYIESKTNKQKRRLCGIISSITEQFIVVQQCSSLDAAFSRLRGIEDHKCLACASAASGKQIELTNNSDQQHSSQTSKYYDLSQCNTPHLTDETKEKLKLIAEGIKEYVTQLDEIIVADSSFVN